MGDLQIKKSSTIYDVVIVGSGAGGGMAGYVLAKAGEAFAIASGDWRIEFTLRPAQSANEVWLAGKFIKNDKVVGAPTLLSRLGDKATVKAGAGDEAFALSMVVSR